MSKIQLKKLLYSPISLILALILVFEPMSAVAAPEDGEDEGQEQSGEYIEMDPEEESGPEEDPEEPQYGDEFIEEGEVIPESNPEELLSMEDNDQEEEESSLTDSEELPLAEGESIGGEEPVLEMAPLMVDRSGSTGTVNWYEEDIKRLFKFYVVDPDSEVLDDEYIVLGSKPTVDEDGVEQYSSGCITSSPISRLEIADTITISATTTNAELQNYAGRALPVREIGPYCFYNATSLMGVIIPEGITAIGEKAFYNSGIGSTDVEELNGTVNIPASVTTIGAYAFSQCSDLHKVTATPSDDPDNTLEIASYAFSNGTGVDACLELSEGVEIDRPLIIDDNAFYNSQTASLVIPQVQSIGGNAFYGSALNSFVIPKTLTEIGAHAFGQNRGNLSVTYEPTGEEEETSSLTIGSYAFANGSADNHVVSLELDSHRATTLGDHAFYNNQNMRTLAIAGIVSAPESAFENCGKTAAVQSKTAWPTNLSVIEKSAFKNCKLLESVDLTNVTSVANDAFRSSSVSTLTLPATSEDFGTYVFSECSSLTSVTVPEDWDIVPKGTFQASGLTTLTVLGETEIGEFAFDGCASLQTASMENVEKIDRRAFYNCTALESVDAQNAVEIGQSAFEYAKKLENIKLPDATTVAENAFAHCTSLQYAYLPLLETITKECFKGNTSLKTVYMPQVKTISNSAFEGCTSLLNTKDPTAEDYNPDAVQFVLNNTTEIKTSAFSGCSSLQNVEMNKVTNIGTSAFYNCTNLADVDMTAVQTIGDSAFSSCTHLADVDMTAVQAIGKNAFLLTGAAATNPSSISFPDLEDLTSIGEAAFTGSRLIDNVDLTGKNLALLGNNAFEASSISGLKLPETQPTSFGTGVFSNCADLTNLTIPTVDGGYNIPDSTFYNTVVALDSDKVSVGPLHDVGKNAFTAAQPEENRLLKNCDITINGTVSENAFTNAYVGDITFNSATLQKNSFTNAKLGDLTFNGSTAGVCAFEGATVGDVSLTDTTLSTCAFENATTGNVSLTGTTLSTCTFAGARIIGNLTMNGAQIGSGAFAGVKFGNNGEGNITISGTGTQISAGAFAPGVYVAEDDKFCYLEEDIPTPLTNSDKLRTPVTFDKLTIDGSNTKIGDYAFLAAEFESLQITENASGTILGDFAFSKTEQAANANEEELIDVESDTLKTVSIGTSDIMVGDFVFNNRVGINTLTLPDEEPAGLGSYIFANCRSLTNSITIPEAWTYLPDGFFYGCTGITYLYLPENLNRVGAYVFTTKGTPGNHVKVWFESSGRISISSSAFHGVVSEDPEAYSYLEIHLENKPKYSVSGFAGGWGAYQIENTHYWIFWKPGEEGLDPDCFFAIPRVILGGNNYNTVTDSNLSTFIEVAVKLGNSNNITPETLPGIFEDGALKEGFGAVDRDVDTDHPYVDYYTITQYTIKDTDDIVEFDYLYYLYYDSLPEYTPSYIEPGEVFDYKYTRAFDANYNGNAFSSDYAEYIDPVTFKFDFKQYIFDQYHESLDVKTIGESAFAASNDGFEHIYVPDTVTSIENSAFQGQANLKNLTKKQVNGGVAEYVEQDALMLTNIGASAFQNCYALESLKVADTCPKFNVGNDAFNACSSLSSIDWPQVGTIGTQAFKNCTNLATVEIDWVDRIGNYAFDSCTHLTNVDFGHVGTDNAIGQYAFQNCYSDANGTGLTHFHIGSIGAANAWANIDTGAFSGCSKLNDFQIDSGYINNINMNAFNGVSTLSAGTFNFGIKNDDQECVVYNVGAQSFHNANKINTLYFDRVVNISEKAFTGSLDYPGSTIEIDNMGIPEGGATPTGTAEAPIYGTLANSAFNGTQAYHIEINNGKIGTVANSAFYSLGNVQTIKLCDVDTFGSGTGVVVYNCPKLTTLTFGNVNRVRSSACLNSVVQNVSFVSVKEIDTNAFKGCNNLKFVSIPGAEIIGDYAFQNCGLHVSLDNITYMEFPDTVKTIGSTAFGSCRLLGEVIFPHGAGTSVGADAFASSSVSSIVFDADPPATMGTGIFSQCVNLTSVVFPNENSNWTKIPDSMFYKCTVLEAVDLGSVKEVGQYAFEGCKKLAYVDYRGVERIKMGAFGLTGENKPANYPCPTTMDPNTVNKLPNTVTEVGVYAFHRNYSIESADLSHITGANKLGRIAFWRSSLSSVTLPASSDVFDMTNVDVGQKGGFFAETKLTSVTVPGTWENIYDYTFAGCTALTTVTIGGTAETGPKLCNGAFSGCTALTNLTINGNSEIDSSAFAAKSGINFKRYSAVDNPASNYSAAFAPNATVTMDNVKKVNANAFKGCVNLAEVSMQNIENIGESAFDGCIGLRKINYAPMKLQEHKNFRQTNPWYTEEHGIEDEECQYNDSVVEDYLYKTTSEPNGHVFEMSCIPNTIKSIGAFAFRGCPIKNLYIADVRDTDPAHLDIVGGAFSGIGCVLENGAVKRDENDNLVFVTLSEGDTQDYVYIFIQHSLNTLGNAPWSSNAIIEWDDGVIGSPEYGLYYSYSTGKIVSVYDQRTVIETPEELPDALGNQHTINGFADHCFASSGVQKLILNDSTDFSKIENDAFRMYTGPIKEIFIPIYKTDLAEDAIIAAICLDDGPQTKPDGVKIEWLLDPNPDFPLNTYVDGIPDEPVTFQYQFENVESSENTLSLGNRTLTADTIYAGESHEKSLEASGTYGRGGVDTDGHHIPYLEDDTTNNGKTYTYKFSEIQNSDQFSCDIPEVWCDIWFTRETEKTNPNFSINYTTNFDFYTYENVDGEVVRVELGDSVTYDDDGNRMGLQDSFIFENKGARPVFLVYNNEAPAGYTMTFADGMLNRVAMVKKYEVIIQGGVPTCSDGDTKYVFAGWALSPNAEQPDFNGQPYEIFKNAGENVETQYTRYIVHDEATDEDVINLYPVWKDGKGKTFTTTFGDVIEPNDPVNPNGFFDHIPKKYGYTFTGYAGYRNDNNKLQVIFKAVPIDDNEWRWDNYVPKTFNVEENNFSRYAQWASDSRYHWYDRYYSEAEDYVPATLVAQWKEIPTPRFKVTLQNGSNDPPVFYTEYNDSSCYVLSTKPTGSNADPTMGVQLLASNFGYYTAPDGGVRVIYPNGTLVPGVKGWTTDDGKWIASAKGASVNRILYAHEASES